MQGKWLGFSGVTGFNHRFIPAMRIQTLKWGSTSSDFWYSLIEGNDFIPEFAIGRFPVADVEELDISVKKTLERFQNPGQIWESNVINIGGYEVTFKDQSETLIQGEIESGSNPIQLYIDKYSEGGSFYGTTDSLVNYINNGVSYINFFGHGGGAVWADRSLLTLDDIDLMNNTGKYPFVTSMTCFSGDVTNPNALGRKLLNREDGGVIGWLGSAGLGWIINDYLLLKPIHKIYFSDSDLGVGEIINLGKIKYYATNTSFPDHAITQIFQFNLSGDPALVRPRPGNLDISVNPNDPEPGETLSLSTAGDSLTYVLYDEQYYPLKKYPEVIEGGTIQLSDTRAPDRYTLLIKGKEQNKWKTKSLPMQIAGTTIRWVSIEPQNPARNEPVEIQVEAVDRQGIDSLSLWMGGIKYGDFISPSGNLYTMREPLTFPNAGNTYSLMVKAVDSRNNVTWSSTKNIHVKSIIDVKPLSISHIAEDSTYLKIILKNFVPDAGDATLVVEERINEKWLEIGREHIRFRSEEHTSELQSH